MDAPIYIHYSFFDVRDLELPGKQPIQNQLFVIEERDGAAREEIPASEQTEQGKKSGKERDGAARETPAGEQSIESDNENGRVTNFPFFENEWVTVMNPPDFENEMSLHDLDFDWFIPDFENERFTGTGFDFKNKCVADKNEWITAESGLDFEKWVTFMNLPDFENERLTVMDIAGLSHFKSLLDLENERVTVMNLPDLGYTVPHRSGLAVAKSRLFIVGGYDYHDSEGVKINGIRCVNLAQDNTPSWETSPLGDRPEDFGYVGGTAVSDDGNLIYGFGLQGKMFAFDPVTRTLKSDISSPVSALGMSRPILLAVTDTKMYLYCASALGDGEGLLGYCDIKSLTWHTIDPNARLFSLRSVVVIRDSYLISFAVWHPLTEEFCPALYVYDIGGCKWLPEPVQGLSNDGYVLPSFTSHHLEGVPINESSVMQVRRDELKLALVWCSSDDYHNEFHWSKFILSIQENDDQDVPPTFRAEYLSSACFSATGLLVHVKSITA